MMRFAWALPCFLAACASAAPVSPPVYAAPAFDPLVFFAGRTEGTGHLHVVLSRGRAVHVHGTGAVLPDGSLRLTQTVDQQGKPETKRVWLIRRTAPDRYTGTLSDAKGPIAADTMGNRLHIRFRMKGGLTAEQWLVLEPDGRAAQNRMTVRKFGVVLATLDEHIVRGS